MRSVACIAADLSQEDLAAKLELKLQQSQRYEGTESQSASLARVHKECRACKACLVCWCVPRALHCFRKE